MTQDSGAWMPHGQDSGLIHHVWHALGRLEEGQRLNRESAETRAEALREHMDARIDDLKESLSHRIDKLEDNKDIRQPWWVDLPWKHIATLAVGLYLALQGHLTSVEIKALLMKMIGL